jgi:hypothetical protein
MWPVLGAPHQRVYGEPSDPLGEVWRLEGFRTGAIDLVGDTVAEGANAPDGVSLRRAVDATQVLYDVPAWALAKALPAVPAYNLIVWVALWSAGLAAFWALRRLGVRWEGAAAAGLLFMLAPVHVIEAQLHSGLAFVAPLPVALALGIAAVRRPSARAGAAFGALVAACGYVTAYLLLEAVALAVGIAVAAVVAGIVHRERIGALARAAGGAAAAGVVVATPLIAVLASERGALDAAVARPTDDVAAYSLTLGDVVDRDLTSYIGLVGLGAGVAGLIWGRGGGALRGGLAAVTVAGAWFALSPDAAVLGAIAPGAVIHAALPYWRVYGRVEIVAALGVACLAGLAVARLAERPGAWGRAAAAALVAVACMDVLRAPPRAAADLGRPDPAAAWLAGARANVAEFPLRGFDDHRLGPILFRQMRHDRPLLNGGIAGTRSADLSAVAGEADGRQARAALAVAGVDRIVVAGGASAPPGLAAGPHLPRGARGWSVPPDDGAAVALSRGGLASEPGPDGSTFRWLGPGDGLRVLASCPGTATVSLTAVSHSVPRAAEIAGRTYRVGTGPTPLRVTVPVGASLAADLTVRTEPPPAPLPGGDPRVAGIGVYGLSATLVCGSGLPEAIG